MRELYPLGSYPGLEMALTNPSAQPFKFLESTPCHTLTSVTHGEEPQTPANPGMHTNSTPRTTEKHVNHGVSPAERI